MASRAKLALKQLTPSDLTFFEWHFRNRNAGNQKSINLNADIFEKELYPLATEIIRGKGDEVPVTLSLFGPGGKGLYRLTRKIVKGRSYKNWRLNGEFIFNPEGESDRFNCLLPGDLVLMGFNGEPVPASVDLLFIASENSDDNPLFSALSPLITEGRRSMVRISEESLIKIIENGVVAETSPLHQFVSDQKFDENLQDASFGSKSATDKIRRQQARPVTADDLAKTKANAAQTGREGEGLVYAYLLTLLKKGILLSVEWSAQLNAVAPYDFLVITPKGTNIKIDAKSTSGEFNRMIHISGAELDEIALEPEEYEIYRVYNLSKEGANVRTCKNLRPMATAVTEALTNLPEGVRPDSFSILPNILIWGEEFFVQRPDEFEDGE